GQQLAHFNLGLAFRQKAYYNEALREYRLALERGEDRKLVLQATAEVYLLKRDLAAALELYENLVKDDPESPKLWNERGVVLLQAGHRRDAEASFRRAVAVDAKYPLAWNNLGVALSHLAQSEGGMDAFRAALQASPEFTTARLNLALLLFQLRRFQLALEAFRQVLAIEAENPVAWNGVGLVLVELRRYPDARNAFARAVEADPKYAAAHYNLSFTLSNLGDFDGALRETKRALELDPYYVPQKFRLTIDLQYEDPTISIVPDISADVTAETVGETFSFDQRLLDNIFEELAPAKTAPAPPQAMGEGSLALARDYVSKGLLELATAEATRAVGRGADRA
ncbi:MAG: tetratricopeptide repeat protein, partial [Gemmatimonadales bacterium]